MKTKYHQPYKKQRLLIKLFAIIILLPTLFFIYKLPSVHKLGLTIFGNMASVNASLLAGVNSTFNFLTPKSELIRENQELQEQVRLLSINNAYTETQKLEEKHISAPTLSLLGLPLNNKKDGNKITGEIVSYESLPYGTFLVHIHNTRTKNLENKLATYGGLVLGRVIRQSNNNLTVKLYTASNEISEVTLNGINAKFTGKSNGSGEILLPRNSGVSVGDIVTLPQAGNRIIGIVTKIHQADEDPMETLYISLPVNLNNLRYVTIEHE